MTDEFKSYGILESLGYIHETVKHSEREYARGEVHINNCENRVSLLRPWLSKDTLMVIVLWAGLFLCSNF